jgi:nucleoside-diphosphate-sugar epimerase
MAQIAGEKFKKDEMIAGSYLAPDRRQRVLMTGAAGQIGQLVIKQLADHYDFVLTDIRPLPQPSALPFTRADIADLDAVRQLCRGADTVLHLAAVPLLNALWEDLLPANLVGVYNVFQAARETGCRRVIFTSSIQVVEGHAHGFCAPTAPIRPVNLYGATKAWGEALGSVFAAQHGLSVLCLRLGWVLAANASILATGRADPSYVLTHKDLIRLIAAALAAPDNIRFGVFHGLSANRWQRLETGVTQLLPGYAPQDDAFALVRGYIPRLRVRLRRIRQQLTAILRGEV